jgi:hypothetical protein
MRQIVLAFLLSLLFYPSLYSHCETSENDDSLKRDSLPVFVIRDKNLSAIIDSFLVDVQSINYTLPVVMALYIDFYENGSIALGVELLKQRKTSDSTILYLNPNFRQAFVLHQDVLFQVYFGAPSSKTLFEGLSGLLTELPTKQPVLFRERPKGFYEIGRKGYFCYQDHLIDWSYFYINGIWESGAKFYNTDNYDVVKRCCSVCK